MLSAPGTSHWTAIEEVEPASDLKVVEYSAPKVSTSDRPTNMLPFVTLDEVTWGVNLTEAQIWFL